MATVNCLGSELRSCEEVKVDVLGSPSLISLMVSVDVRQQSAVSGLRAQELWGSQSGRPGFPVPNKPYGFCQCKASQLCLGSELRSCEEVKVDILGFPIPNKRYGFFDCKAPWKEKIFVLYPINKSCIVYGSLWLWVWLFHTSMLMIWDAS